MSRLNWAKARLDTLKRQHGVNAAAEEIPMREARDMLEDTGPEKPTKSMLLRAMAIERRRAKKRRAKRRKRVQAKAGKSN